MKNEEKKMTLQEYQDKYVKYENEKKAKAFLFVLATLVGILLAFCLFMVVTKIYDYNEYAGYAAIALAVILFVFIYVIPVVKMGKMRVFMTNVNALNAREAKKHNKMMREELADKMIDLREKTTGVMWYSDELCDKLVTARTKKNDKELKDTLTKIYDKDVKKAANKMIRDHAFKVGVTTALSQSEKVDTLFVVTYDLSLIKDIIYLYGFRPTDARMATIYKTIIANALVSYGIGNSSTSITTGIAKKVSQTLNGVPFIGGIAETVIDSVSQGVINSALTVVIGIETKKFLNTEYHLQDILDDVVISEEEEEKTEEEMITSLNEDIRKASRGKKVTSPEA